MEAAVSIFQCVVKTLCCIGLAVIVACALIAVFLATVKQQQRLAKGVKRSHLVVAALLTAVCIIYGGSKNKSFFVFDDSLMVIPEANYATNDLVHIEWDYNHDIIGIDGDTVFVSYKPISEYTNNVVEWADVEQTWKVSDRVAEFELADATNYCFRIWTDWVPEETVVTNGVYHLSGFERVESPDGTNRYVSLRVNIRIAGTNGVETTIAPVRERKKEE